MLSHLKKQIILYNMQTSIKKTPKLEHFPVMFSDFQSYA